MSTFRARWCLFMAVSLAGGFIPGSAGARAADQPVAEIIAQRLDPGIKPEVRDVIINDFVRLSRQKIEVRPNSPYAHIFGADGAKGVARFVLRRIAYILPPGIFGKFDVIDGSGIREVVDDEDHPAGNLVRLPFYYRVGQWRNGKQLRIGSIVIPNDSPVSGLCHIGSKFTVYYGSTVMRIGVWVHEARHSDFDIEILQMGNKEAIFCRLL